MRGGGVSNEVCGERREELGSEAKSAASDEGRWVGGERRGKVGLWRSSMGGASAVTDEWRWVGGEVRWEVRPRRAMSGGGSAAKFTVNDEGRWVWGEVRGK